LDREREELKYYILISMSRCRQNKLKIEATK
jgi:hypothetical protein